MYTLKIEDKILKLFKKLEKKNKIRLKIIKNKIGEILENPHHFKPLSFPFHGERRVHIDKPFVLIYEIDEENKIVKITDFDHHDDVY